LKTEEYKNGQLSTDF